MFNAERKCRRIKYGRIPFSPDSLIWIIFCQVYISILRYHSGKNRNRNNPKRSDRRCVISGPLQLSLDEVCYRLQVAHEKCKYFRKHGHRYRRKHPNNIFLRSHQSKYQESEKEILAIFQREKDLSEGRRQNYAMEKPMSISARIVQESSEDGGIGDFTGQDKMENMIWDKIGNNIFHLAEQAPICQGKL